MKTQTWSRLLLTEDDLGLPIDEVARLPWVSEKVASVTRLGPMVEIQIGPYAGNLFVRPGLSIEIAELVPGTVAACINLSRTGRRYTDQPSPGALKAGPTLAVAQRFIEACSNVLGGQLVKEYMLRRETLARPCGKIDLRATLQGPRARGRASVTVCTWRQLTEDTPFNRLLLSAAIRAEHIIQARQHDCAEARRVIGSLSGAQFVANPLTHFDQRNQEFDELVGIARLLIEGTPLSTASGGNQPVSAWVNVERVFEEAVFELCLQYLPTAVTRGVDRQISLFHSDPTEPAPAHKSAEPDVVIEHNGKRLILDAKYRRSGEHPSEGELYQLIAHAVAYRAEAAALVTPALNAPPARQRLGRIETGCAIEVISVDPASEASVTNGVERWLAHHYADPTPGLPPPLL